MVELSSNQSRQLMHFLTANATLASDITRLQVNRSEFTTNLETSELISQFADMSNLHLLLQCLLFLFSAQLFCTSQADVGTAAQYSPPFLPTACYGNDISEFPPNNMFGSASEGLWNNGAACGRQYLVKCLSAEMQGTCIDGETIQVTIVDRATTLMSTPSASGTTMVLSAGAYSRIADSSANIINIEFQQI